MSQVWNTYLKNTAARPPQPLLCEALEFVENKGNALDLGCGVGADSRYLTAQGFIVTSVDANEGVKEYVPEAIISTFEDFPFLKEKYVMVNAQYSLPFCTPQEIKRVIKEILESLALGGIFAGQFFGPEDTWANRERMNFETEVQVREFFDECEILVLREEKSEGKTAAGGSKFWHVFHVIARKSF